MAPLYSAFWSYLLSLSDMHPVLQPHKMYLSLNSLCTFTHSGLIPGMDPLPEALFILLRLMNAFLISPGRIYPCVLCAVIKLIILCPKLELPVKLDIKLPVGIFTWAHHSLPSSGPSTPSV